MSTALEAPWVHKATCTYFRNVASHPAVIEAWHGLCQSIDQCTHPHKPFRDAADLQAWVRFWALTAKLCDGPDLPCAMESPEEDASGETEKVEKAEIAELAQGGPDAQQGGGDKEARTNESAALHDRDHHSDCADSHTSDEPGRDCTYQPEYNRASLETIVNANKTLFAHVLRDDEHDEIAVLRSAFMASKYGKRLLQAVLEEDISEPFIGSYAHSLITLCDSEGATSVLHKHSRNHPTMIQDLVDHIMRHVERDAKNIRKHLTVGPQHRCCDRDFTGRRHVLLCLLFDLRSLVVKLVGIRASTKLRLFNAVLRTCGKESMTPQQVQNVYVADEDCGLISPYIDKVLLMPLATELVKAEKEPPLSTNNNIAHEVQHELTCRGKCYCTHCANCGGRGATLRCARCDATAVCSKDCFREYWKEHKMWCTPTDFAEEPDFQPRKYALDNGKVIIVEEKAASDVPAANSD